MADSNITKLALSNALKELLEEQSFEKISVSDICERCHMNRKSFYYHFKDKYDLVNWIFDTEFAAIVPTDIRALQADDHWDLIERICNLFYQNRRFYRKALQIEGQNSLGEHLRQYFHPMLKLRLAQLSGDTVADDYVVEFFCDALIGAIKRWLDNKNSVPPEYFVPKIKHFIKNTATAIFREIQDL